MVVLDSANTNRSTLIAETSHTPEALQKRRFWVEWPESQELLHLLKALFAPIQVSRILHKHKHYFLPIGRKAYVWPIVSGWAIPSRTSSDGRSKCTQLVGPRDIIGISAFGGNERELEVYPLTDVAVVGITSLSFCTALRQNLSLASLMFTYASNCYARALDEIERVSLYPLEDRLKVMEDWLTNSPVKHLSDTEAGWIVGAHPGSVSRATIRSKEQELIAHDNDSRPANEVKDLSCVS